MNNGSLCRIIDDDPGELRSQSRRSRVVRRIISLKPKGRTMSKLIGASRRPRIVLASLLILGAGLTALASGQIGGVKPPARHFEYLHQEILASALTQSLNDLDGQGWEVFQVVPSWQIKNENSETILSPRAYEVFGRRVVAPK
jgi:hypothetical protein